MSTFLHAKTCQATNRTAALVFFHRRDRGETQSKRVEPLAPPRLSAHSAVLSLLPLLESILSVCQHRSPSVDKPRRWATTYKIGWAGYFALDQVEKHVRELGQVASATRRACYWKQWRKSTTRLKKRISLDVAACAARGSAMSGKGAWRLSKTSSVQSALSIEYLTNEGLLNLEERWRALASMRRTAQCGPAC